MDSELLNRYLLRRNPDGVIVVHFAGRHAYLDESTFPATCDDLVRLTGSTDYTHLYLDLRHVEYVSGAALGTLVHLHKRLLSAGRRLSLCNVSRQMYEVFKLMKLDKYLDVRPAASGAPHEPRLLATAASGVLVVDDDRSVCGMLEAGLQSRRYRVWSATNGFQGIDLYRKWGDEVLIVLLDVVMPGIDGPRTLGLLQAVNPDALCCFMAPDPCPFPERALLALGALRVFRKPFALTEVYETLAQLSGRPSLSRLARHRELTTQGV